MADKNADKAGAADKTGPDRDDARDGGAAKPSASTVPGVKRPAHTIDLKADEVKEDAGAAGAGAAKKTGESARSAKSSGAGKKSDSAANAARKEPPQRTTPRQMTGFITHLAAGLLGGVIGILGAGYGLGNLPPGLVGRGAGDFQTGMTERVGALESRLAAVEKNDTARSGASPETDKRLAALEQQAARGGQAQEAQTNDIASLQDRVGRLDETLKALEQTARQGGDIAQTAAVRGQIDEAANRLGGRIDTLKTQIDEVSGKLADAAAAAAASAKIASRLDAVEQKLGALQSGKAEAGRTGEDAALAIRLTALARAAEQGAPFARELTALRESAPSGLELSPLEAHAESGVPSRAALQRQFQDLAKAAAAAKAPAKTGDSFVDQLVNSARSVVRIRRTGGGDGPAPRGVLSRMAGLVRDGDLKAAAGLAGELPEASRSVLEPWLEQARARAALDAALANLSDDLARRLAAGAGEQSR